MTKQEFLEILRRALGRELSTYEVEENLRYYDAYFNEQIELGKTEEEVSGMLGDPRLIARTILDVKEQKGTSSDAESNYREEVYTENADGTTYEDKTRKGNAGIRFIQLGGWKVVAVMVIILALIFLVIGATITLIWKLLPIILLVMAGVYVYHYFFDGRR